jgi:hypothetical protein
MKSYGNQFKYLWVFCVLTYSFKNLLDMGENWESIHWGEGKRFPT